MAVELQVIQEHMGGGRHLVPWWKDTLDFNMRVDGKRTPDFETASGATAVR